MIGLLLAYINLLTIIAAMCFSHLGFEVSTATGGGLLTLTLPLFRFPMSTSIKSVIISRQHGGLTYRYLAIPDPCWQFAAPL